jgi:hypothetical protein
MERSRIRRRMNGRGERRGRVLGLVRVELSVSKQSSSAADEEHRYNSEYGCSATATLMHLLKQSFISTQR